MFDVLPELFELLVAGLLTAAGVALEWNALQWLGTGHDPIVVAWLAYMGVLALYAGLFVVGGGLPRQLAGVADR